MTPSDSLDFHPRETRRANPHATELWYALDRLGLVDWQVQIVTSGTAHFLKDGRSGECDAAGLCEVLACLKRCSVDELFEIVGRLENKG